MAAIELRVSFKIISKVVMQISLDFVADITLWPISPNVVAEIDLGCGRYRLMLWPISPDVVADIVKCVAEIDWPKSSVADIDVYPCVRV